MRVCRASRCTFDTRWEVFSKRQELVDVHRGPVTAALNRSRHALLCGYWLLVPGSQHGVAYTVGVQLRLEEERMERRNERDISGHSNDSSSQSLGTLSHPCSEPFRTFR